MRTRSYRTVLKSRILLAATAAALAAPAAPAGDYAFQTLDVPFGSPEVDLNMQFIWINDAGVVTAQYQLPTGGEWFENLHTAILQNGAWTVIDVPGAVGTGGTNPNNHGQVVLSYLLAGDDVWHAAVYGPGGLTPVPDIQDYPGGFSACGVNDFGQIAASVIDAHGVWHGFVGDAQDYDVFDYPGAVYMQPNMVNNAGVCVGYYLLADGSYHSFRYDNGVISNSDMPPAIGTDPTAWSINNAGVILGNYINTDGRLTGYLQTGEEYAEFGVPGASYTLPNYINDRGQISGIYADADGVVHGFVANPPYFELLGDIDGDCEIGLADLGVLLAHFGTPGGATYVHGDIDSDGDVDLTDLSTLLSNFGATCP